MLWSIILFLLVLLKHVLQEKLKTVKASDGFSPALGSYLSKTTSTVCRNTLLHVEVLNSKVNNTTSI